MMMAALDLIVSPWTIIIQMKTMTPQITRGCSWNPPTLSLVVVDKCRAVCVVRLSLSVDLHRHTHPCRPRMPHIIRCNTPRGV